MLTSYFRLIFWNLMMSKNKPTSIFISVAKSFLGLPWAYTLLSFIIELTTDRFHVTQENKRFKMFLLEWLKLLSHFVHQVQTYFCVRMNLLTAYCLMKAAIMKATNKSCNKSLKGFVGGGTIHRNKYCKLRD